MISTVAPIKLQTVLIDAFRIADGHSGITHDDVLEAAAAGWEHMFNYSIYQNMMSVKKITTPHKVDLPSKWHQIHYVMYKPLTDTTSSEDETIKTSITACDEEVTERDAVELKTTLINTGWQYMMPGHSSNAMAYMSSDSPCLGCPCDHSFEIEAKCCMTVSPKEGYVMIFYRRPPMDENGDYLIPDMAEVKLALKNYVMMEINERLWNQGESGAQGRYLQYLRQWEITNAAAIGQMLKPSLSELYAIATQNRLVRTDSPARMFERTGFEGYNPW